MKTQPLCVSLSALAALSFAAAAQAEFPPLLQDGVSADLNCASVYNLVRSLSESLGGTGNERQL